MLYGIRLMRLMLTRRRVGLFALMAAFVLIAVNAYPYPFFAYSHSYRGFMIASDKPIDPAIDKVLDDVRRRLSTSTLYQDGEPFRIFLCNSSWRLRFFVYNANLGGGTIYPTRNIFIRESDIAANKVVAPNGGNLLDEQNRPLSYFIAHEATHMLELRRFGLVTMFQSPFWLVEGYADVVGKGGDFDIERNRNLLIKGDPLLSEKMGRNGLYRRYQLMVATELRRPDANIERLFAAPPLEQDALADARAFKN